MSNSDELIAEYLCRVDAGERLDPQEFIEPYPDQRQNFLAFVGNCDIVANALGTVSFQAPLGSKSRPLLLPGQEVAGYSVQRLIGSGGMGVVYAAMQVTAGREVALKTLHADRQNIRHVDRFLDEAHTLASLSHPGIVPLLDARYEPVRDSEDAVPIPFYVMELVAGGDLRQLLIDRSEPLSPLEAVELLLPVAEAVHFAHERGILHCDIKPANILIDPEHGARLSDFSLALRSRGETGQEGSWSGSGGTPQYMAPEQAQLGEAPLTVRADVYGLGATLHELVTGLAPIQVASGVTLAELVNVLLTEQPVLAKENTRNVPEDLRAIILRCLAKEPRQRYSSVSGLIQDLRHFTERRPVSARPIGKFARLSLWSRRNPMAAVLTSFLSISIVLGTVTALVLAGLAHQQATQAREAERRVSLLYTQERERSAEAALQRGDWQRVLELAQNQQVRQDIASEKQLWWQWLEAQAHQALNHGEKAREVLDRIDLQSAPTGMRAKLLLARADINLLVGDKDPNDDIQEAIGLGLDALDNKYAQALLAKSPRAALDLLEPVVRERPYDPWVMQLYCANLLLAGEHTLLDQYTASARLLYPNDENYLFLQALGECLREEDFAHAARLPRLAELDDETRALVLNVAEVCHAFAEELTAMEEPNRAGVFRLVAIAGRGVLARQNPANRRFVRVMSALQGPSQTIFSMQTVLISFPFLSKQSQVKKCEEMEKISEGTGDALISYCAGIAWFSIGRRAEAERVLARAANERSMFPKVQAEAAFMALSCATLIYGASDAQDEDAKRRAQQYATMYDKLGVSPRRRPFFCKTAAYLEVDDVAWKHAQAYWREAPDEPSRRLFAAGIARRVDMPALALRLLEEVPESPEVVELRAKSLDDIRQLTNSLTGAAPSE